jgi:hypothetical protein
MTILNEAVSFYSSLKGSLAYAKSGNNYPVVMIARDNAKIEDSSDLVLVKIGPKKLNSLYDQFNRKQLSWNSTEPNVFAGWDNDRLTEFYNNFIRFARYPTYLHNMTDVKEYLDTISKYSDTIGDVAEVIKFSSPKELAKYLILKQKNFDPYHIKLITGVSLENEDDTDLNFVTVGNTQIVFPDNMRGKKQKEIIDLVNATDKVFALHGMSYLTNIKMFVKPIQEKWSGLYYLDSKIIAINTSARASKSALHTMVHEIGHKYYYEFMSMEKKREVVFKYMSLIKSYKKPEPKEKDHSALYQSIWDQFSVGDELTFVGVGRTGNFNPYEIISITTNEMKFASKEKSPRGKPWVTGHFELKNMVWVARNYLLNGKQIEYEAPKADDRPRTDDGFGLRYINDGWFPTAYSATSPEEWFAECWAFYLLGQIEFEPLKEFFEGIIKQ